MCIILTIRTNWQHILGCFAKPQVNKQENDAHEEANAANNYISNSEERILSTQQTRCGNDNFFGAFKLSHFVVVVDLKWILSVFGKSILKKWSSIMINSPVVKDGNKILKIIKHTTQRLSHGPSGVPITVCVFQDMKIQLKIEKISKWLLSVLHKLWFRFYIEQFSDQRGCHKSFKF